jgi:hypothetical protein
VGGKLYVENHRGILRVAAFSNHVFIPTIGSWLQ